MQRRPERAGRPKNRPNHPHRQTKLGPVIKNGPTPPQAASQTPAYAFPDAWTPWVDETIPQFVKSRYSPKENWKDKPFDKPDVRFFLKGVQELSELFTQERPRDLPAYFRHPKFRSAYLLYFMPLQAAKFILLFQQHAKAVEAALKYAKKTGVLRIADLGAGPGTASFALLLILMKSWKEAPSTIPDIELLWVDTNPQALEDGRLLFDKFCETNPELKGRVKLRTEVAPWWKAPKLLDGDASLILLGNVLNEASDPTSHLRKDVRKARRDLGPDMEFETETHEPPTATIPPEWKDLLKVAKGGGILVVDPAARGSSQRLSRIRDLLLPELKPENPRETLIWGPCLHLGACPLAQGRDWCHFSVPMKVPGKWFREFSIGLGSERHWVKFSYLWIAAREYPAPAADRILRRVISDPLDNSKQDILICEPGTPRKFRSARNRDLRRGDVIRLPSKS